MSDSDVTLAEVYRAVRRIEHALNGNGSPGLVKAVERHDAWLKVLGSGLLVVAGAVVKTLFG